MGDTILSLRKINIKYDKKTVIKDVSFEIEDGDFVCVVGANGAGKSTLIKSILGLIKPVGGRIVCREKRIGYLPQEMNYDKNFPATVFEIVLSGNLNRMGWKSFYGKQEKERAKYWILQLKIEKIAKKSFASLSGGQKQKVLLARALTATENLLFLDEPTNSLDYVSRKEFYEILKNLNKKDKKTIVMITHDLDADDLIGNKVVAIENGKVSISETKQYLRSFR